MKRLAKLSLVSTAFVVGCTGNDAGNYDSVELYPLRSGSLCEMEYTPSETTFSLWAPTADSVVVNLYAEGNGGKPLERLKMTRANEGTWQVQAQGDKKGQFYAFNVMVNDKWLGETPGIFARAVGANGNRGAIIDLESTNPDGWESDARPKDLSPTNAVIYEVHHRDFSVAPNSGIEHKGKFLALAERGTCSTDGLATGLDHLVELGITHVHILPSFDYASVDETRPDSAQYNWGYDPKNYNVPEGSYSTDAADPAARIREMKQMIKALHEAGIGVVLDVVYNHTFDVKNSNFQRTVPGYFYRHRPDGSYADASGCSNETASERPMMRKFICESVRYWATEYHIDGFRFDLMGIHDAETMRQVRQLLNEIDPNIIVYGEGWAAATPQLPQSELAMKANTAQMPGIAAFSDELRDALRGPFSNDEEPAFLAAQGSHAQSIRFGIVGGIQHPDVDMTTVNYTDTVWAGEPQQMICYVSCHDDMCLVDRLRASIKDISDDELIRLDLLAQTVVMTSQGTPFMLAGEELLRSKKGVHNSYNSPDSINQIDWHNKLIYANVFDYYKDLIALRKAHPAFRMGNADEVRKHLHFIETDNPDLIAYELTDNAGGDEWNKIVVAFNASKDVHYLPIDDGTYTVVCRDGKIDQEGLSKTQNLVVMPQSALIAWQ